jgi:hypothetical protein
MWCPVLTHYTTFPAEPAGRRVVAHTLLGLGALVVHAIRSGRDVLICDANSSERLVLDTAPDGVLAGQCVVRWRLAEEGGDSRDGHL